MTFHHDSRLVKKHRRRNRRHRSFEELEPRRLLAVDSLEPNDSTSIATEVSQDQTIAALSIDVGGDQDFFKITVPTGVTGTSANFVEIEFSHSEGDLDLELQDANGDLVASSESTTDDERISLEGLGEGMYFARVFGFASAAADYTITFDLPKTGGLTGDRLEANNSIATATEVIQDQTLADLSIHDGSDEDFFKITVPAGATGTSAEFVEIQFSHGAGDLDLELQDANGDLVASSESTTDDERISLEGLGEGMYFARVFGFASAAADYTITFDLPDTGGPTGDRLEANNSIATATEVIQDQTLADLSIHDGSDEDFFKITVPAGATGTSAEFVQIQFSHGAGDLDLELQAADGTTLASSTSTSDDERISLEGLGEGMYFARVFGFASAAADYTITFDLPATGGLTGDRLEANNSIATATDVRQDQTLADLSIHDGADEDFFKITVPTGATGTSAEFVQIQFSHGAGDLDLELQAADGTTLASSTSTSDDERISLEGLGEGMYFARVFGYQSATAAYQITFDLPATGGLTGDRLEANNNIATATDVRQDQTLADLSIHDGADEDFFKITLPAGATGTSAEFVQIQFSHGAGDLDLELQDANGDLVASSESTTDDERISLEGLGEGMYFARVFGFASAAADYTITFDLPDTGGLTGDRLEANNSIATATDVRQDQTLADLSIHDGADEDFFKITLPAGATGTSAEFVQIRFAHANGNLDLELQDANGNTLRSSTGTSDSERISLEGLGEGMYFARVYGYQSATAAYQISFDLPQEGGLTGDRLEANNSIATATEVRQDQTLESLSIHDGTDEDFFKITVPAGATGTSADFVEIQFTHADGDLDMRLQDATGQQLAISQSSTDNERISLEGLASGMYFVQVFGYQSATAGYNIAFDLPVPMAGLSPDRLEANNSRGQATDVRQDNVISGLTIHSGADEDFFKLTLPAAGTSANFAEIRFSHGQGDLQLQLQDSSGNQIVLADSATDNERISLDGVAAGMYFLRVFGASGATAPYAITIDLPEEVAALRRDRLEANDSTETATPLRAIEGRETVENVTIHASGGTSNSDFFSFQILAQADNRHFVEARFIHAVGNLELRLLNSAGQEINSSTSSTDNERISLNGLAADNYFIEVFGASGAAAPYALEINAPFRASSFEIQVFFPDNTLGPQFRQAFVDAAARWSRVITGDLPDIVTPNDIQIDAQWLTGSFTIPRGTQIDDVMIVATGQPIDGNTGSNTLAHASWWRRRTGADGLPYLGIMEFDTANLPEMLAQGTFLEVVMHEMGHVISPPSFWMDRGLALETNCEAGQPRSSNPRFVGTNTLNEYKQLSGDQSLTSVPLEAVAQSCGSYGSHWAENVFDRELMTPSSEDAPPMPLSRVTVGMLDDLGYQVDYNAADAFSLPGAPGAAEDSFEDVTSYDPGQAPTPPVVDPLEGLFLPDPYEGNEPTELRQSQTLTNLTAHQQGDVDLFTFELMGAETANHFFRVSSQLGRELDLELRDASGAVLTPNLADAQTLSLAGLADGRYTVAVTSEDFNRYDLTFSDEIEFPATTLDVTGSGSVNPFQDGILIVRHMFGQPNSNLEDPALFPAGATRTTGEAIRAHLVAAGNALDVNGDGNINPFEDGILIVRFLFGQPNANLEIPSLIPVGSTRTTGAEIRAHLNTLLPPVGSAVLVSSPSGEGESVPQTLLNPGDVNGDGLVTTRDALSVLDAIQGEESQHATSWLLDANQDGRVSAADALFVVNRLTEDAVMSEIENNSSRAVDRLLSDEAFVRSLF